MFSWMVYIYNKRQTEKREKKRKIVYLCMHQRHNTVTIRDLRGESTVPASGTASPDDAKSSENTSSLALVLNEEEIFNNKTVNFSIDIKLAIKITVDRSSTCNRYAVCQWQWMYLNVASSCCATVPQAMCTSCMVAGDQATFAVRAISFTFIFFPSSPGSLYLETNTVAFRQLLGKKNTRVRRRKITLCPRNL